MSQEMFRSVVVLKGVCELRKREKKTSNLAFLDISMEGGIVVYDEALWCREVC